MSELISRFLRHIPEFQRLVELHFWPLWFSLTAMAAALAGYLFHRPLRSTAPLPPAAPRRRFRWSPGTIVPLCLLAVFVAGYCAIMLMGNAFVWYDDSDFTHFTLHGVNAPMQIWTQGGRFFPLCLQEYSVIRHFTSTVTGYYAFSAVQVVIFAGIVFVLDDRLSYGQRVSLAIVALAAPATVASFLDLAITERDLFLWLACFALLIKYFDQTYSARWAVGVAVCAQFLLFTKEPMFFFLLAFATSRMFIRRWTFRPTGWRDSGERLDLFIAALSLVFTVTYAVVMLGRSKAEYLVNLHMPWWQAASYYLQIDWLIWIFSVVAVVRMYRILRRKTAPDLLWDGLACGGLTYFAAFIAMGLAKGYYTCPVDLIAVLYLGHVSLATWGTMRSGMRFASVAAAAAIVCQTLQFSPNAVLERKRVTHVKAAIAGLIADRYRRHPTLILQLYFPYTGTYVLEEFLSYLDYLGLPVEREGDSFSPGKIEVFSANKPATGKCLRYDFICHAGAPDGERLTIVLPDDLVAPQERAAYKKVEQELVALDPQIHPPNWLSGEKHANYFGSKLAQTLRWLHRQRQE